MNAASTASHGLFLGQSCYLTTISLNCLIVCLVSDDIRENSSLNLNKFICDELQPNEEFHRLFNDAFNSLYRKLQTDLQDTEYATESTIHNLIKVSGQTTPSPRPKSGWLRKTPGKSVVVDVVHFHQYPYKILDILKRT